MLEPPRKLDASLRRMAELEARLAELRRVRGASDEQRTEVAVLAKQLDVLHRSLWGGKSPRP